MIKFQPSARNLLLILLFLVFFPSAGRCLEILTYGDSITQGLQRTSGLILYGVTSPVNGAANIGGYQPYLNNILDQNIESSNAYNWGVSGETSLGGLGRIESVLSSRVADYILILYGANDLNAGISASATKANVKSMVQKCRQYNVVPILSELTPYNSFTSQVPYLYNPAIRALAEEENTTIVLMYENMIKGWNSIPYHSGDGLHLSDLGYVVMSNYWFEAILKEENAGSGMAPIYKLLLNRKRGNS